MSEITDEEIDGMMDWYDQALASGQGFKSEEEREAYFAEIGDPLKHPFWAESAEDMEGHPLVEAFRCLREEDKTQVELALLYKDEGNEWMKTKSKKNLHEAHVRYTHALTFLDEADKARREGTEADADKGADLHQIRSQILNNRALTSMHLKNYGVALKDINKALLLWQGNIKAHFRKAKCLYEVRRPELALRACISGLEHAPESDTAQKELTTLKDKCQVELDRLSRLAAENEAKRLAKESEWREAWKIATGRGASLGPAPPRWRPPPQLHPKHMPFVSTEDGSENWPLVVLYPQYSQIDIIQGADPSTMLVMLIAEMFPEPENGQTCRNVQWDTRGEYYVSNLTDSTVAFHTEEEWMHFNRERGIPAGDESDVECASMTYDRKRRGDQARPVEVHLGCTIEQVLRAPGFVVEGGLLSLLVFPKGSSALDTYLNQYSKQKTGIKVLNPNGQLGDYA